MVFKLFLTRKQVVMGIVFVKFCVWIKYKVNAGALKSTVVLLCIVAFLRRKEAEVNSAHRASLFHPIYFLRTILWYFGQNPVKKSC